MKLLPNIYQVGGSHLTHPWDCSVYLINSDPKILIDCGTPNGFHSLKKNLNLINVDLSEIQMIIGTHCHYDHLGAAKILKDEFNIKIAIHKDDQYAVENGDGELTCANILYKTNFPKIKLDIVIDAEITEIKFKNYNLLILHTPGHTPGSSVIFATFDNFTILFAGDSIWGGYHPKISSDIEKWKTSLDKILTYDFDVMVWGHSGSIVFGDAKERVLEARQSLGEYFFPWHQPSDKNNRYSGNPMIPGMVEYPSVF